MAFTLEKESDCGSLPVADSMSSIGVSEGRRDDVSGCLPFAFAESDESSASSVETRSEAGGFTPSRGGDLL